VKTCSGEHRFVAGATDLEVDQALVFELDFFVVEPPRQQHRTIRAYEVVTRQPFPRLLAR
jgi:hypothetical protein